MRVVGRVLSNTYIDEDVSRVGKPVKVTGRPNQAIKTRKLWLSRKNCTQHQLQRLTLVIAEVHSIVPIATQTGAFVYVTALQERHSSLCFQLVCI